MVERSLDKFFGWLKCSFKSLKASFLGFLNFAYFIISWTILR